MSDELLTEFLDRLQQFLSPFARRVDYGNLRSRVDTWDDPSGKSITNVALVYETPGGSTDQINISYFHAERHFVLLADPEDEVTTTETERVIELISPRVEGIPQKRRETLYAEIRRLVDGGITRAGLLGHLNRIMQSEFKGGTITHIELKDAMTFAINHLKE